MTVAPIARAHEESNLTRSVKERRESWCMHTAMWTRSFYLHHVTKMEDHDWESISNKPVVSQLSTGIHLLLITISLIFIYKKYFRGRVVG